MARKGSTRPQKSGVDVGYKPVILKPRTARQREYMDAMMHDDVIFCTGPAGSGKTHVAIGMAVQMVRHGFLEKIIITRPLVSAGRDMGFLPGDLMSKVGPYVTPCFDELNYYLSFAMIKQWQNEQKIEVVPLSTMRGRTFNSAFVILDEAQNATHVEIKNLLTRIGDPSRTVLAGDLLQSDLPNRDQGAFREAIERLEGLDGISVVGMTNADIVRHRLIAPMIERLW